MGIMDFFKRKKVEEKNIYADSTTNVAIPNKDDFTEGLQNLTENPNNIEPTYSERDYSIMYFWKNCKNINYDSEQIRATIAKQYPNANLSDLDISVLRDLQGYKYSPQGIQELAEGSEKDVYMSDIDNVLGVVEDIIHNSTEAAKSYGYNVDNKNPDMQKIISNFLTGKSGQCIDKKYKESLEKNQDDISL